MKSFTFLALAATASAATLARAPTCDVVRCADGYVCKVIDNQATCVPKLTCATVLCASPNVCEMVNDEPTCVAPAEEPVLTCNTVKCIADHYCVIDGNRPTCVPFPTTTSLPTVNARQALPTTLTTSAIKTCSNVRCPYDCVMVAGEPTCVDPCADIQCIATHTCVVEGGQGVCVPVEDPCADIQCIDTHTCVVKNGQGVCVPVEGTGLEGRQEGEVCGPSVCGETQFCCNESCGICADIDGGVCTQQFCGSPSSSSYASFPPLPTL